MAKVDSFEDGRNWAAESRLRLARRRGRKPDTKAAQIRALWPEIAVALESGQSVKCIRDWLEQDAGITVGITSLTSYISRIRRREAKSQDAHQSPRRETVEVDRQLVPGEPRVPLWADGVQNPEPHPTADPIAEAMRALTKPRLDIRKLHSDGDPTGKGLI